MTSIPPYRDALGATFFAALCTAVASCAVAANDAQVDTIPMRQALDLARSQARADVEHVEIQSHLVSPAPPLTPPSGLLTSPDVRFAYLYEWVDPDGNRHFGEWIAIPVGAAQWIMNDGTRSGIESSSRPNDALREQR
jgi:hypothetical protein